MGCFFHDKQMSNRIWKEKNEHYPLHLKKNCFFAYEYLHFLKKKAFADDCNSVHMNYPQKTCAPRMFAPPFQSADAASQRMPALFSVLWLSESTLN